MKVNDIMNTEVHTCGPQTDLNSALLMMWNNDCGCIPVVDESGAPVGIVTDRDIAMSCALNYKPAWELTAGDIISSRQLITCESGADIQEALDLMNQNQIRRLPVTNDTGALQGLLSMKDAIEAAKSGKNCKKNDLSFIDVMSTLKAIESSIQIEPIEDLETIS